MIERFRPAGHKAQELSNVVLQEETLKPIQRVIERATEKTVGYLYHGIEYRKGMVDDIVLSARLLIDKNGISRKVPEQWRAYEQDPRQNPIGWTIPSGPTTLDLCYQSSIGHTSIYNKVREQWNNSFRAQGHLQTSTLVEYSNGIARVRHNWIGDAETTPIPERWNAVLSDNNPPDTNKFLHTMLGRKYTKINDAFKHYGSPITLWTLNRSYDVDGALVLGVAYKDGFSVDGVDNGFDPKRPARGVALAKQFLEDPKYEVRDD